MQYLVLTVIGDDKPGLVQELATTIREHGGNWLDSSLAHLAGKFAGIVRVAISAERAPALQEALSHLADLRVMAETAADTPVHLDQHLRLSLMGHDRPGIIQEVAQVLTRLAVNVEELSTYTSSAAMSGDLLFHAQARLSMAKSLTVQALQSSLEALSNELMVELAEDEDTSLS